MNRVFTLLLVLPVLFLLLCYFAAAAITNAENEDFESYRLQRTVNYATDAAASEMLSNAEVTEWNISGVPTYVSTNADDAYNMFMHVFSLTYNGGSSKEARDAMAAQYLKMFMVLGYRGFNLYDVQTVDTDKKYIAGLTIPYVIKDGSGNPVAATLDARTGWALSEYSDTNSIEMSPSSKMSKINNLINTTINLYIDAKVNNGLIRSVDIPVAMRSVGAPSSSIDGPTVLAFVDGANFGTVHSVSAFSIGGSRVSETRRIACYKRGENKYYAYLDALPAMYQENINDYVDHIVTSMEEAAELGYCFDYTYMT